MNHLHLKKFMMVIYICIYILFIGAPPQVYTSGIYIKCWILFAEFSFGNEPYLEPQGKHLNMREKKLPSVSDDGTTFEEYLNGKFLRKKM